MKFVLQIISNRDKFCISIVRVKCLFLWFEIIIILFVLLLMIVAQFVEIKAPSFEPLQNQNKKNEPDPYCTICNEPNQIHTHTNDVWLCS